MTKKTAQEMESWAKGIQAETDTKISRELYQQKNRALDEIERVESKLKKHPKKWAYELRVIDTMRAYVRKYKFLPDSYERMLTLWEAYETITPYIQE